MCERKYCGECGEEILIAYVTPEKVFRIDDTGHFVREDNNDAFCPDGDSPTVEFICSNDREHDIGEEKLLDWMLTVEESFRDSGIAFE